MPTYTIQNKEFGTEKDIFCTYNELQEMLKKNKQLVHVLSAPALVGDHVVKRMDGGMKDTFSRIAEAHPNSPLAERYGKKSVKQTQIEKTIKKHRVRKSKGGGR